MTEINVKPSEAKQAIRTLLEIKKACCVWGSPGIGKSQIIKQVSRDMELTCKDVRAVLLDPVDLRGLPHVNGDGRAHWAIPDFLPRGGKGVLFLDELNRAPVLVQNACFQLVLDRKLGEYELPDNWSVIAACNRETDGGGITRMPSALANRFIHLNLEVSLDDWCNWAAANDIDPMLIGFMRFRPNLLHDFNKNEHAFPSPRSWEFVSSIVRTNMPANIELALVAGAVGNGAAIEFASFVKLFRNAPSIDFIIMNPTQAPVPTDAGTLYAVSAALATRAKEENFERITQYLNRKEMPPEYAVYCVKDAVTRDSELQATAAFTKWALEHSDLM